MPTLEEALQEAFEAALEAEVPPQEPSITDLVNVLGGPGRGGGTGRLAGMLGVDPRTVQRWLKTEREGLSATTRRAPSARLRGLTAEQRATLGRLRGLWTDRDRRIDVLDRRLRGRKLVVDWDITWEPYPEQDRPAWRDGGRWGPVTIPSHRAAPIIRSSLEGLRTGDVDAWERAAGLLGAELAAVVGLPAEAEVDETHSLSVSFE
jgi:hypothetical protein